MSIEKFRDAYNENRSFLIMLHDVLLLTDHDTFFATLILKQLCIQIFISIVWGLQFYEKLKKKYVRIMCRNKKCRYKIIHVLIYSHHACVKTSIEEYVIIFMHTWYPYICTYISVSLIHTDIQCICTNKVYA
jgi:hypothetical protein